jgi:protein-disulfide isomerase-like protein with CxxC motif
MSLPSFTLLYDYRCPFARIVHEHVLAANRAGAELAVTFAPFTLNQGYVPEGAPAIWDSPEGDGVLIALEASIAVRDTWPASFAAVHEALFEARHTHSIALSNREQVASVLESVGLDVGEVFAIVDSGGPRRVIANDWTHYHRDLDVFGVPTFVFHDQDAVFLRLMEPPNGDDEASAALMTQLIATMALQPSVNELKHTRVPS